MRWRLDRISPLQPRHLPEPSVTTRGGSRFILTEAPGYRIYRPLAMRNR